MTKEEYAAYLQNPLWKAKRLEILKRDGNKCTECGATSHLQAHHIIYRNLKPWEYNNEDLITLCKTCHKAHHKEHGNEYDTPLTINRLIVRTTTQETAITCNEVLQNNILEALRNKTNNLYYIVNDLITHLEELSKLQTTNKIIVKSSFNTTINGYINLTLFYKKGQKERVKKNFKTKTNGQTI